MTCLKIHVEADNQKPILFLKFVMLRTFCFSEIKLSSYFIIEFYHNKRVVSFTVVCGFLDTKLVIGKAPSLRFFIQNVMFSNNLHFIKNFNLQFKNYRKVQDFQELQMWFKLHPFAAAQFFNSFRVIMARICDTVGCILKIKVKLSQVEKASASTSTSRTKRKIHALLSQLERIASIPLNSLKSNKKFNVRDGSSRLFMFFIVFSDSAHSKQF
ncbi:CLUMA_CG015613, isoform A [Clunio marinus]|uniref:CLUMA_CG015613, isoform A n=1 Tax=Clunio marinus TaxID=568069 RepID=A0A1J1IQN7_9DIPT|nr:CLUMA_CG015613, isoform A [Clunio marinus]